MKLLIRRTPHGRWSIHCPLCLGETAAARTHTVALRLAWGHITVAHKGDQK